VAGLSEHRPVFDSCPVHVRFVVDKVALGPILLRILQFYCQYHSTYVQYSFLDHCRPVVARLLTASLNNTTKKSDNTINFVGEKTLKNTIISNILTQPYWAHSQPFRGIYCNDCMCAYTKYRTDMLTFIKNN
jgi:hypothetical protein